MDDNKYKQFLEKLELFEKYVDSYTEIEDKEEKQALNESLADFIIEYFNFFDQEITPSNVKKLSGNNNKIFNLVMKKAQEN